MLFSHLPSPITSMNMHFAVLLLLAVVIAPATLALADETHNSNSNNETHTGRFLWFTDNHVDTWGNISIPSDTHCACTPQEQWNTAVTGMQSAVSTPDFIIFSGDFVHASARNSSDLTRQVILDTIGSVSLTLQTSFPGIRVFPCLGNHDYSPSNQFPSNVSASRWLYDDIADLWAPWLPPSALLTLRETGWYSADAIPGKLRVIALNTNYWAVWNRFTDTPDDDRIAHRQIVWFEKELQMAERDGVKVYVIGHHPPVGIFTDNFVGFQDVWPLYAMRYRIATQRYAHVIKGQFYGHDHVDEVRIVDGCRYTRPDADTTSDPNTCDGNATGVVYIGPAMTHCNEPSFRVWDYDVDSAELLDYWQYHYRSRTKGASNSSKGRVVRDWPLHYRWSSVYNSTMTNLSPQSWKRELQRLAVNGTAFELDNFFRRRGHRKCDDAHCRAFHFCNVLHTEMQRFLSCVFQATKPRLVGEKTGVLVQSGRVVSVE